MKRLKKPLSGKPLQSPAQKLKNKAIANKPKSMALAAAVALQRKKLKEQGKHKQSDKHVSRKDQDKDKKRDKHRDSSKDSSSRERSSSKDKKKEDGDRHRHKSHSSERDRKKSESVERDRKKGESVERERKKSESIERDRKHSESSKDKSKHHKKHRKSEEVALDSTMMDLFKPDSVIPNPEEEGGISHKDPRRDSSFHKDDKHKMDSESLKDIQNISLLKKDVLKKESSPLKTDFQESKTDVEASASETSLATSRPSESESDEQFVKVGTVEVKPRMVSLLSGQTLEMNNGVQTVVHPSSHPGVVLKPGTAMNSGSGPKIVSVVRGTAPAHIGAGGAANIGANQIGTAAAPKIVQISKSGAQSGADAGEGKPVTAVKVVKQTGSPGTVKQIIIPASMVTTTTVGSKQIVMPANGGGEPTTSVTAATAKPSPKQV